jgi:hypothetical protein
MPQIPRYAVDKKKSCVAKCNEMMFTVGLGFHPRFTQKSILEDFRGDRWPAVSALTVRS